MTLPRICIVAPFAYPLFAPECGGAFGGSEVRAAFIARELVRRRGFDVHLVVYDHGQPEVESREGVTIHHRRGERPPPVPSLPPRPFTRAWLRSRRPATIFGRLAFRALAGVHGAAARVRASRRRLRGPVEGIAGYVDEYPILERRLALYESIGAAVWLVAPGGLFESAEVAFHCRRRNRAFIYLASSDSDLATAADAASAPVGDPSRVQSWAIANATAHVLQNDRQDRLLRAGWERSGFVWPNPVDPIRVRDPAPEPGTVLWIGKSSTAKAPERVLELAGRLPQVRFLLVLNPVDGAMHRRCLEHARRLGNVRVTEYVRFSEVEELFATADVLVNTSAVEGFPNAFLQAAKYGVPVVSLTVDPGGMLEEHGAGFACGGDPVLLAARVAALIDDRRLRAEVSERAMRYVREVHDSRKLIGALEEFLLEHASEDSRVAGG